MSETFEDSEKFDYSVPYKISCITACARCVGNNCTRFRSWKELIDSLEEVISSVTAYGNANRLHYNRRDNEEHILQLLVVKCERSLMGCYFASAFSSVKANYATKICKVIESDLVSIRRILKEAFKYSVDNTGNSESDEELKPERNSDLLQTAKHRCNITIRLVCYCLLSQFYDSVHHAAFNGNRKVVDAFIRDVPAIVAKECTNTGGEALHAAVIGREREMTKHLIVCGCDVNGCDYFGSTPLMLAVLMDNTRMARDLRRRLADPYIADIFGDTPRSVARARGSKEMLEILQGREVNVRFRNSKQQKSSTCLRKLMNNEACL